MVVGGTCTIVDTDASTLAGTSLTPSRICRVKPYHLAPRVAGAVPKVRRDGRAAAVEVDELESGPVSATDRSTGIASRNASASSACLSKVQPDETQRASEQLANQRRVFAYIVGDLL